MNDGEEREIKIGLNKEMKERGKKKGMFERKIIVKGSRMNEDLGKI